MALFSCCLSCPVKSVSQLVSRCSCSERPASLFVAGEERVRCSTNKVCLSGFCLVRWGGAVGWCNTRRRFSTDPSGHPAVIRMIWIAEVTGVWSRIFFLGGGGVSRGREGAGSCISRRVWVWMLVSVLIAQGRGGGGCDYCD